MEQKLTLSSYLALQTVQYFMEVRRRSGVSLTHQSEARRRGRSPTVREGLSVVQSKPSLMVGLLPRPP